MENGKRGWKPSGSLGDNIMWQFKSSSISLSRSVPKAAAQKTEGQISLTIQMQPRCPCISGWWGIYLKSNKDATTTPLRKTNRWPCVMIKVVRWSAKKTFDGQPVLICEAKSKTSSWRHEIRIQSHYEDISTILFILELYFKLTIKDSNPTIALGFNLSTNHLSGDLRFTLYL